MIKHHHDNKYSPPPGVADDNDADDNDIATEVQTIIRCVTKRVI